MGEEEDDDDEDDDDEDDEEGFTAFVLLLCEVKMDEKRDGDGFAEII